MTLTLMLENSSQTYIPSVTAASDADVRSELHYKFNAAFSLPSVYADR